MRDSIPAYSPDKNNSGNGEKSNGKVKNPNSGQPINIEPGQDGLDLTNEVEVSFDTRQQLEKCTGR